MKVKKILNPATSIECFCTCLKFFIDLLMRGFCEELCEKREAAIQKEEKQCHSE